MKNKLLIALCFGLVIAACHKENSVETPTATPTIKSSRQNSQRFVDSTDTASSTFIPINVANTMINSYLYSIGGPQNDTDIESFSVNADSLMEYLANNSIHNVKLIFAHTMAYINAGNNGVYAGYQSGALTIIIAGYDANGNYVYYNGCVLDHLLPCPYTCPPGNAGNALLQ